jgi:hypothetical protein
MLKNIFTLQLDVRYPLKGLANLKKLFHLTGAIGYKVNFAQFFVYFWSDFKKKFVLRYLLN